MMLVVVVVGVVGSGSGGEVLALVGLLLLSRDKGEAKLEEEEAKRTTGRRRADIKKAQKMMDHRLQREMYTFRTAISRKVVSRERTASYQCQYQSVSTGRILSSSLDETLRAAMDSASWSSGRLLLLGVRLRRLLLGQESLELGLCPGLMLARRL